MMGGGGRRPSEFGLGNDVNDSPVRGALPGASELVEVLPCATGHSDNTVNGTKEQPKVCKMIHYMIDISIYGERQIFQEMKKTLNPLKLSSEVDCYIKIVQFQHWLKRHFCKMYSFV